MSELLISSRNTHTHARKSFGRACGFLPLEVYVTASDISELRSMGEDVWSLVSRQLYESSTKATRPQEETKESGENGEGKAPGGEEDLDQDAEKDAAAAITTAASACTSFALCVGMPGAGKSTLLNTYLNPNNDSIPKPTVALEYMFARRASAATMPKVSKQRRSRTDLD